MIRQIKYKGEVINLDDVEVTWTDCFGYPHTGSIEDYASDYAEEQVAIEQSGEGW